MLSRRLLVLAGAVLVALPTAPVAEGAAKQPRLTSLRGVPAAVQSGKSFRVRGRVTNLPKSRKKSARLVLHAAQERALHPPADREGQAHEEEPHAQLQRPHQGARHRARRQLHGRARASQQELPLEAAAGDRQAGAHARPRTDAARPARGAARPAQPARAADRRELLLRDGRPLQERQHGERQGRHRLERSRGPRLRRGPQGLLPRRRPRRPAAEDRLHQGPRDDRDLAHPELQEPAGPGQRRPNRSAGYHGYWVTDFTQIDPHFGTNAELQGADRGGAREEDEGLLRHHHQPHRGRHHVRGGQGHVRLEGRRAVPDGRGHAVRRPRLRRRRLPAAQPDGELPLHAGRPARHDQDAGVAERPDDVPQPRQHDVRRRGLAVRRLLRARRPLHRAQGSGRRDGRHLREVDPRHEDRRLPHRHHEARQRRVLADVLAHGPEVREARGREGLLHVRRGRRRDAPADLALHDPQRSPGRARLPVPGGGPRVRREVAADRQPAQLLPRRRLLHRRGLERLPAADVPREPRRRPHRDVPAHRQPVGDARVRAARARPARAPAHVLLARQPGRLLRRRAGLHRAPATTRPRARTCGPASTPSTTTSATTRG